MSAAPNSIPLCEIDELDRAVVNPAARISQATWTATKHMSEASTG